METTKILWSGLTGKTGREAIKQQQLVGGVQIVAGMKRNISGADDVHLLGEKDVDWFSYKTGMYGLYGLAQLAKRAEIDVIVDFSHPDVFNQVLELAICTNVPLISGTANLSDRQMAMLYDATGRIPVFRGGNFRFKVKKFIDRAVEAARNTNGHIILFESFYEGKSLPSETSKVIRRRIYEATGKTIEVYSEANLPKEQLPCNWKLDFGTELRNSLTCHTIGFDELAHDVLEIAKVMTTKPIKRGDFYDLDEIWDELPTV